MIRAVVLAVLISFVPRGASAAPVRILVAANFRTCLQELTEAFATETRQTFTISSGATGQLYAQIVSGAPCDLFFAAGQERPRLLVDAGRARAGDCLTYALGELALVGLAATPAATDGSIAAAITRALRDPRAKLAIANPQLAPYGRAAQQALTAAGLWDQVQPQLVRGQSINQAWQFVRAGAAQLGFVSVAQVRAAERVGQAASLGTRLDVPATLHAPIVQQVVLLTGAPRAAREFLEFVLGPEGRRIRRECGYGVPPE